jgi:hypothetical protein
MTTIPQIRINKLKRQGGEGLEARMVGWVFFELERLANFPG